MAGRNISVTHVAQRTVRVMRTTSMMGEVLGMVASIVIFNYQNSKGGQTISEQNKDFDRVTGALVNLKKYWDKKGIYYFEE